ILPQRRLLEAASLNPSLSLVFRLLPSSGKSMYWCWPSRGAAFLDSTLIDSNANNFNVHSKAVVDVLNGKTDRFVVALFEDRSNNNTYGLPKKVNERLINLKDPTADIVSRDACGSKAVL
ncbi:MAG: hypothetical protein K6T91_11510, partial [Firmicutes bacterium]|nr:hypothetical protein [Bacillota bacterium]